MDIVLRATVMFAVVFLLLRLMGKRELAEMTPFEFVMLVVIGDLIQQGVTHNDFSLTGASLAVMTFAFWGLVLNFVSNKSRRAERLIDGQPSVIVRDGVLLHDILARNRLTNGKISFIEAKDGKPPNPPQEDAGTPAG